MAKCGSRRIADVLRGELVEGRYGEALRGFPSVKALRERFCVGEYAVRHALQRLRKEGLLELKQGIGAVPTAKASCAFKGRVAFIGVGTTGSYFPSMLSIQLARRFREAGWDFAPVFITAAADGLLDAAPIRQLAANGLDFAIVCVAERQIAAVCDDLAVPYIVLNGYTRNFPNARAVIRESFRWCYAELIRHLRERNVQSLIEFDLERTIDRGFENQLFEAGINIHRILCEWNSATPWTLADAKRAGHKAVMDFFANEKRRRKPPDALLFDDDYLAVGGLAALHEIGLRVPQDIKVVFYSNKGNEPVLGVAATRIENDPVSYGDTVAAYVLKLLSGRRAAPPRIFWRFIPGATL